MSNCCGAVRFVFVSVKVFRRATAVVAVAACQIPGQRIRFRDLTQNPPQHTGQQESRQFLPPT